MIKTKITAFLVIYFSTLNAHASVVDLDCRGANGGRTIIEIDTAKNVVKYNISNGNYLSGYNLKIDKHTIIFYTKNIHDAVEIYNIDRNSGKAFITLTSATGVLTGSINLTCGPLKKLF